MKTNLLLKIKINSNIIADAIFHFHPNCKIRLDKKKNKLKVENIKLFLKMLLQK